MKYEIDHLLMVNSEIKSFTCSLDSLDMQVISKKKKKVLACIFMTSVRGTDAAFSCCFLNKVLSAYGQTAAPLISIVLGQIFPVQIKVKLF